MIELGGNIKLDGFDNLEPAKLIVIKKLAGSHTKRATEKTTNFKEIVISLKSQNPSEVEIKLTTDKEIFSLAKDKNLFYALDKAFSSIIEKI